MPDTTLFFAEMSFITQDIRLGKVTAEPILS
jgi:hypothetical protein